MPKVSPFLWFDTQAHDAAKFYVALFKKGSKITSVTRYGAGGPGPAGSVMTVGFTIGGQELTALNAGPQFKFSPAISFVVICATQKEVDHFWNKLVAGGARPTSAVGSPTSLACRGRSCPPSCRSSWPTRTRGGPLEPWRP